MDAASGTWTAVGQTMSELTFDTMAAVRHLRDSRLDERQAVAITETVREGITGNAATNTDLAALGSNMVGLETRLTNRIHAVAGAVIAGQVATASVVVGFLSL